MELTPRDLTLAERYKLLIGAITPRPIAVVATRSPDGRPNLAPFSFFAGVGSNPMTLLFCPANTDAGEEKDSLRNAKPAAEGGTGEFVICIATDDILRRVAAAAEPLPYGQSEFEMSGLTPAPSVAVTPPRVAESPVAFECRTLQVLRTNPGAPAGGNIVLGEVVHAFVLDELLNERMHIDQAAVHTVGRMGGLWYCRTNDRLELPMGRRALDGD